MAFQWQSSTKWEVGRGGCFENLGFLGSTVNDYMTINIYIYIYISYSIFITYNIVYVYIYISDSISITYNCIHVIIYIYIYYEIYN